MSHTNSTANYNLPQFLGTDKPSWLTDVNQGYSAIDTQMKANADAAATASSTATAASVKVGNLSDLTTTVKTSAVAAINEVATTATAASSTATAASTAAATATSTANTANANATQAQTDIAKFNLSSISTITVTPSSGTVLASQVVKVAKDSTGSIFKFYGRVDIQTTGLTGRTVSFTTTDTGLRPTEAYTINGAGIVCVYYVNGTERYNSLGSSDITVNTNGTITIGSVIIGDNSVNLSIFFPPCIYFNKSFGDQ